MWHWHWHPPQPRSELDLPWAACPSLLHSGANPPSLLAPFGDPPFAGVGVQGSQGSPVQARPIPSIGPFPYHTRVDSSFSADFLIFKSPSLPPSSNRNPVNAARDKARRKEGENSRPPTHDPVARLLLQPARPHFRHAKNLDSYAVHIPARTAAVSHPAAVRGPAPCHDEGTPRLRQVELPRVEVSLTTPQNNHSHLVHPSARALRCMASAVLSPYDSPTESVRKKVHRAMAARCLIFPLVARLADLSFLCVFQVPPRRQYVTL